MIYGDNTPDWNELLGALQETGLPAALPIIAMTVWVVVPLLGATVLFYRREI